MKLATTSNGQLRRFFSPEAVAKAINCSAITIIRMIQREEITAIRWKKNILRIPEEELERIMQRQREGREFKPETVSKFIPEKDQSHKRRKSK